MLRITGGTVYDPANYVHGDVRDVCIADGTSGCVITGSFHVHPAG